ncbi:MAG: hypothetical protein Q9227_009462 [Pyrenula ochraceoflavens]
MSSPVQPRAPAQYCKNASCEQARRKFAIRIGNDFRADKQKLEDANQNLENDRYEATRGVRELKIALQDEKENATKWNSEASRLSAKVVSQAQKLESLENRNAQLQTELKSAQDRPYSIESYEKMAFDLSKAQHEMMNVCRALEGKEPLGGNWRFFREIRNLRMETEKLKAKADHLEDVRKQKDTLSEENLSLKNQVLPLLRQIKAAQTSGNVQLQSMYR